MAAGIKLLLKIIPKLYLTKLPVSVTGWFPERLKLSVGRVGASFRPEPVVLCCPVFCVQGLWIKLSHFTIWFSFCF